MKPPLASRLPNFEDFPENPSDSFFERLAGDLDGKKIIDQYHSWFYYKPPPKNFEMLKIFEEKKKNLLKT